ncbi:TetR/AcrR family transcriptional regulator [Micromonospora sp. NPDC049559]|uniref:TetR/AcrR family transcriptional regulator n=1 Tax=Micromonospora sp. NPDC049559 TaxID=3155923 RepID=UPI0034402F66
MPKIVDHHERRTLIVDALMRVAARDGLEAVSLRHVAAEAGVTTGMVQHYFRTKEEMMEFAMAVVRERGEARITEAVGRLGPAPAPRELIRTMITELLPLDEARRADARVALAFLAYAAVRPVAAASLRQETPQLVGFVADQIRAAQAAGAAADVDPATAAAGLLAVMEGLGIYLLTEQYAPRTALDALDAQLSRIFG